MVQIENKLIYQTGAVGILHKKHLKLFYLGITETLKNLKKSCLTNEESCEKCNSNFLDYRPCEFDEIINEINKIAIVGLYHMWERNLKELLIYGSEGKNPNKKDVDKYSLQDLKNTFNQCQQCSSILIDLFDSLEKYATLTNAIKHGSGPSMKKLEKLYPCFFYNETNKGTLMHFEDGDYYMQIAVEPLVTETNIQELYDILMLFWDNVPTQLELEHNAFETVKSKRNLNVR